MDDLFDLANELFDQNPSGADMEPKAKVPSSCQAGVAAHVYAALLKNPRCTRLGNECSSVCQPLDSDGTYRIELDHIVPRSDGGTNALDNLQWLCAKENRSKYTRPDPRYSGHLYFDTDIDIEKLRKHQLRLGYAKAVGEYRELFEAPERLLSRFMLLAWQVGAGKTVGMASVLFGINHVRKKLKGGSARRIKRVLWLVHQRSLVESVAKEIRTELTAYGICDAAPEVVEVQQASHWGYVADIVVACPQALWDSDNASLDHHRRRQILGEFDAIVVDEAQFAIDQYLDICDLAPLAFKFAITATPMDADGEMFHSIDGGAYRDRFVLYSTFGYEEGLANGFYKSLASFDVGVAGGLYVGERGGEASIQSGADVVKDTDTKEANNAVRDNALIDRARRIAKSLSDSSGFDHHVMVRAGSIVHAKSLVEAQRIHGDTIGVWSGCKGPLLGDDSHPWMLSKRNGGRIPRGGARIVVCIDIGQFGINQPYCSMIVWLDPNRSMIELVQRIGRAIRRRPSQEESSVRLLWNSNHADMPDRLRAAIDYIRDMNGHMDGFVPMSLVADAEPQEIKRTPFETAVKPVDRVRVASMVGELLDQGYSESSALETAVTSLAEAQRWTPDYTSKVLRYGEALQTQDGRNAALNIPDIMYSTIRFVKEERAVVNYEPARLIDAISTGLVLSGLTDDVRDRFISSIASGDEVLKAIAANELRKIDEASRRIEQLNYLDPKVIIGRGLTKDDEQRLKELDFVPLQRQLIDAMSPAFKRGAYEAGRVACYKVLSKAMNSLFGFRVAEEVYQPFKHALADTLMREHIQRLIIAKARVMLMKEEPELFPGLHRRFEGELAECQFDHEGETVE